MDSLENLRVLAGSKDFFRVCNTISEEKQTSIQIEKLKKNLKSGGGRAEFSEL